MISLASQHLTQTGNVTEFTLAVCLTGLNWLQVRFLNEALLKGQNFTGSSEVVTEGNLIGTFLCMGSIFSCFYAQNVAPSLNFMKEETFEPHQQQGGVKRESIIISYVLCTKRYMNKKIKIAYKKQTIT